MKIESITTLRHQSMRLVLAGLSAWSYDTRSEVNFGVGLSEWECWPELEIGGEDLLAPRFASPRRRRGP